jgi:hypothetical protein
MRQLARISLICLAFSCLAATSASASPTRDGWGFGIADPANFNGSNPGPAWGQWFDRLRPKVFRIQMYWDSNSAERGNAAGVIDYARAHGVQQVVVTFKKRGGVPSPANYGKGIGPIITALASRVDVWGPLNEPAYGDAWLPGTSGAETLAQFWQQFKFIVTANDPTALKTSPDFADHYDLSPLSGAYMFTYIAHNGEWGDIAAFHPYWGVHRFNTFTTSDFQSYVPSNIPIWLTEVGGFGKNSHHPPDIINDPEELQANKVAWLTNALVTTMPRIQRVFYYNMNAGDSVWDTGLLNPLRAPRPAWDEYCAASHNDNQSHPDCVH